MDPIARMVAAGAAGAAGGGDPTYVDDVFSTFLYEGTSSNQSMVNGIDLSGEGGLVWLKSRNQNYDNWMFDTERGVTKGIRSNLSTEEYTLADYFSSFNSDGFTVGSNGSTNYTGIDFASWTFRKAPGFFDIVTYTGDGDINKTVSHSLGSVPGMIIVKKTSGSGSWYVWHRDLGGTGKALQLDSDASTDTNYNLFSTLPTDSVFSPGDNSHTNQYGQTYVAYIFAHDDQSFGTNSDEAIIKCGIYTGNGGSDGTEVNLGFEPQFILVKPATGTTGPWIIQDAMRNGEVTKNVTNGIYASTSGAESTTAPNLGVTATGFKARSTSNYINQSGATYIYIAIRRPHKPPTAGTEVFDVGLRSGSSSDAKTNSSILTDMSFILRRDSSSEYNGISSRLQGVNNLFLSNTGSEGTGWLDSNTPWAHMTGIMINGSNGAANTGNLIDFSFKRAPGFFDVVAYTGNGSARTIPHNLGATPSVVIVKSREAGFNWYWQHYALGANTYMQINSESQATNGQLFNTTLPTSSVFSVGDLGAINANNSKYIAYLFGDLDQISKAGTYTGTGSNINVDCGFTAGARFVVIKRVDGSTGQTDQGDWYVWNSARGIVSGSDPFMKLNTTDTEFTGDDYIDPLNSGFTVTSSAPADLNANGGTYLFLAIA